MKKIQLALASVVITQIIPLLGKPDLIFHYKNLVIIIGNICIWLFQPPVSGVETTENKKSDGYSVILIIAMSLLSTIVPIVHWAYFSNPDQSNTISSIAGIIMICSGILLRNYSIKVLGRYFTPTVQLQKDHELITAGPYGIIRHPSYTGALLALVGSAVWLNSFIGAAVAVIAMLTAYSVRINTEETALKSLFGTTYAEYQKRTKKLIPFLW